MTDALTVQDLQFGYGSRATVRGVSLHLFAGDCYGFLGHNGAGKTTVMRLVLGLLRPTAGTIRVFGHDVQQERRRANALIGAVIERPGFHLGSTARENLLALARLSGIPRRLASAETDRVLEAVDLEPDARRRVGTFSMGMRQRLGIAQALLGKPRLLLLDEPTNGLDPEGIADLRALLTRLVQEEGAAIMLSSHQLGELDGVCNRVGVLREGSMVVEGDLDSLRHRVAMRHVLAGPDLAALRRAVEAQGLRAAPDGHRLFVELGARPAHQVLRDLVQAAPVELFAPEQATLERIYLTARHDGVDDERAFVGVPDTRTPDSAGEGSCSPVPLGNCHKPFGRAFAFELRTLMRRWMFTPALLMPCAIAMIAMWNYARRIGEALAKVDAKELFSAPSGSGYEAVAQGLQLATPVLGLGMLWFASQSLAADLAGDTLRNTLIRSLRRGDVLLAKLAVLLTLALAAWALLVAVTMAVAGATFGFGDLEEVTRYGDRDVLAAAADVSPTMWVVIAQMYLPIAGATALAFAMSSLVRHAAVAVVLAVLAVLLPEVLRGWLGEHAGWLPTSHLPLPVGDESALGYAASTARGAADAVWPFADHAVLAPLSWLAAGVLLATAVFRRRRIS
ncbi:MAG: ABC transporter ATP-binding protein [Planctomycetes bacterium]|nr:ABC transporter ATP-binding protein [Planctomycetota bacterium]